jgi:hypothetical protein
LPFPRRTPPKPPPSHHNPSRAIKNPHVQPGKGKRNLCSQYKNTSPHRENMKWASYVYGKRTENAFSANKQISKKITKISEKRGNRKCCEIPVKNLKIAKYEKIGN